MGQFINKSNKKICGFAKTKYFVDKTALINKLLKRRRRKFICNSRARRFGKSVTADMLVAYFSRGLIPGACSSLKCVKDELFWRA